MSFHLHLCAAYRAVGHRLPLSNDLAYVAMLTFGLHKIRDPFVGELDAWQAGIQSCRPYVHDIRRIYPPTQIVQVAFCWPPDNGENMSPRMAGRSRLY